MKVSYTDVDIDHSGFASAKPNRRKQLVQTANHLEQAKSLLNRNASRIALRAVPLAFLAAAAAHAVPNPNALIFNAPNGTNITNSCGGGTSAVTTPLGGASTNNGLGLSLWGDATISPNVSYGTPCTMTMTWSGTGSGLFGGTTGSLYSRSTPGFTVSTPNGFIYVSGWNLSVSINGNTPTQLSCTSTVVNQFLDTVRALRPRGTLGGVDCSVGTIPSGTFAVPTSLSTWQVILAVTGVWYYGEGPQPMEVSVSSNGSIDLLATQGSPVTTVPALAPLAFAMTSILLLCLAGFGILRRNSTGSGFPGQPS